MKKLLTALTILSCSSITSAEIFQLLEQSEANQAVWEHRNEIRSDSGDGVSFFTNKGEIWFALSDDEKIINQLEKFKKGECFELHTGEEEDGDPIYEKFGKVQCPTLSEEQRKLDLVRFMYNKVAKEKNSLHVISQHSGLELTKLFIKGYKSGKYCENEKYMFGRPNPDFSEMPDLSIQNGKVVAAFSQGEKVIYTINGNEIEDVNNLKADIKAGKECN